jgi:hypothetical protein
VLAATPGVALEALAATLGVALKALAATPGIALEALAATLGVALEGLAARRSMARWSPLQSVLMPACGLHGGRYSGMSWRRVRESHPTIVGRRTIIWPIIAPSVLGRPHIMRHSRSPQQRRSTGVTGSTTACSSGNPTRCRRGGAIAEFTMQDQA